MMILAMSTERLSMIEFRSLMSVTGRPSSVSVVCGPLSWALALRNPIVSVTVGSDALALPLGENLERSQGSSFTLFTRSVVAWTSCSNSSFVR